jgi:hypothetical protein
VKHRTTKKKTQVKHRPTLKAKGATHNRYRNATKRKQSQRNIKTNREEQRSTPTVQTKAQQTNTEAQKQTKKHAQQQVTHKSNVKQLKKQMIQEQNKKQHVRTNGKQRPTQTTHIQLTDHAHKQTEHTKHLKAQRPNIHDKEAETTKTQGNVNSHKQRNANT